MSEPFKVEVDDGGCDCCGHGKTWTVVGPDGVAEGVSYDNQDDAEYLASAMNSACATLTRERDARLTPAQVRERVKKLPPHWAPSSDAPQGPARRHVRLDDALAIFPDAPEAS